MGADRTAQAITRIERAAERIDAAAAGLHARQGDPDAFQQLRERHEALRAQVREAIGRMDALFGASGQD